MFNKTTGIYYNRLQEIGKLNSKNPKIKSQIFLETQLLRAYKDNKPKRPIFSSETYDMIIADDHIPFLRYGKTYKYFLQVKFYINLDVPILHLIATPFPPVWHTPSDNEDNLDFLIIKHFRNILTIFVTRYLHLKQQFC